MASGIRTRIRLPIAAVLGLLMAGLLASPAAAADPHYPYGGHGSCWYKTVDVNGAPRLRLNRMVFDPPTELYSNLQGNMVGWRFKIYRSDDNNLTFRRVFAGAIHRVVAGGPGVPGVFTAKLAHIAWRDPVDDEPPGTFFRAIGSFYWYRTNGTVLALDRQAFGENYVYFDGVKTAYLSYGGCSELWI